MTMTALAWGQCARKVKYMTRERASQKIANARKRGLDLGNPYRCPHKCGGWHIGHREQRA